jgi:predicted dienelactone hydrolase
MRRAPCVLVLVLALGSCAGGGGSPEVAAEVQEALAEAVETAQPEALAEAESIAEAEVFDPGAGYLLPGPNGVGLRTFTFEDTSRPTPPNGDFPGAASRTLPAQVWYPAAAGSGTPQKPVTDAPLLTQGGPWPLIAYSHGFMSSKNENAALCALLATRGFVVVAVDFPLSKMGPPGGDSIPGDVINQPGDVRFTLDRMLDPDPQANPFANALDPERIGLLGVSLGGMTDLLVAFRDEYRDPRVKVVATAAAPGCYLPDGFFQGAAPLPLLLIHGSLDAVVPYEAHGPPLYQAAPAPKWLVTLQGGTHTALAGIGTSMVQTMPNPDKVGCIAMTTNPSVSAEALASLAAQAGGGTTADYLAKCPDPCFTYPDLPPAMKAVRQLELIYQAVVPFFEAQFHGDAQAEAFLSGTLAAGNPDVTVDHLGATSL